MKIRFQGEIDLKINKNNDVTTISVGKLSYKLILQQKGLYYLMNETGKMNEFLGEYSKVEKYACEYIAQTIIESMELNIT